MSDLNYVLAKSGVKLNNNLLYTETFLNPKPEFDKIEYKPNSMYGGQNRFMIIDDWARLNFEIDLALTTDITQIKDLLSLSNITQVDDTVDIFTPATNSQDAGVFEIITPRKKYNSSGAKGVFSLSAIAGERVNIKFAISSGLEYIDELASSDQDYTVPVAPVPEFVILKKAVALLSDGQEIELNELSFEMGNELTHIKSTKSNAFYMKDYNPRITIKTQLTRDNGTSFNSLVAGTSFKLEATFSDKDGNEKYKLTVPKAVQEDLSYEDNEGLFVLTRAYSCQPIIGDDNFNIEYIN
jgi:hypothetical protein